MPYSLFLYSMNWLTFEKSVHKNKSQKHFLHCGKSRSEWSLSVARQLKWLWVAADMGCLWAVSMPSLFGHFCFSNFSKISIKQLLPKSSFSLQPKNTEVKYFTFSKSNAYVSRPFKICLGFKRWFGLVLKMVWMIFKDGRLARPTYLILP